eukprot:711-Heterococcus_DN1.PRE.2
MLGGKGEVQGLFQCKDPFDPKLQANPGRDETVMIQRMLFEPEHSHQMMQQAALEERERERISYPHRTPRKRAASKTPKGAAAATAQLLWQRELASDAASASDAPSPQLARLQPSSNASKKSSPAAAARTDRVR